MCIAVGDEDDVVARMRDKELAGYTSCAAERPDNPIQPVRICHDPPHHPVTRR